MAVTVQVRERVGFHRDVYNSLVKCLIRQRRSGEFCDIVLRVNNRRYYAHRAVLAAASPYFRTMFTASMKEQDSAEVDLSQSVLVDADDSFKRVLDFMYCGDIEINVDNVEDVLRIADFLLFDDVKDYCRQFFLAHGNLTLSNCLWVSVLAEHHSLNDVADVARAMVCCRFHDYFVICADELIDLPAPVLAGLFADADVMRFVAAEHLISALLRWVQHDLLSRQVQLPWLLEIVAGRQSNMTGLLSDASSTSDLVKQLSAIVAVTSDISSGGSCTTLQEAEENAAYIDDDNEDEDADDLTCELVRAIMEASEPSDPVLVALNCNSPMKYFRIYLFDVVRRQWRALPLCTEAALGVMPTRLSVCACSLHASILFLLLSHDLPYPSDLQRVHILAFDVGRGRLALLTFSQRRNRRTAGGATPTAVHLQTTMTDVRAVPPVLIHCAGFLCVVGNVDAVGSIFVCDPASSTYTCHAIPGARFVSLARAAVRSDRYMYVWCRHRFGLEAYCVNREVAFAVFDVRRRCFSAPLPPPPGIGYDDFATAGHLLSVDGAGRPVVHSPGRRSYFFDESRHLWAACPDAIPAWPEHRFPAAGELPYRGCELYTSLDVGDRSDLGGVYSIANPAPYVTSLMYFGVGQPSTVPLTPPPVDGLTVLASGFLRSTFCTALPSVQRYDDSFARLVHRKTRQLYDADVEASLVVVGRHDADSCSDSDSSDVEDGLEYDDDIYGYFDDYEYDRSIHML